ncbi:MAG: type II toxin-antitoxin system RelE/ParE family toxin [Trueperaceae bacterium]|nr:type II toxin-antitoxin system RelE/ParE family toxin [Trueperaceae bacterium]
MRLESTREYRAWIEGLADVTGRWRILRRVDRLIEGHPGSHRYLGNGLFELKIDVGPGYRVYYSLHGLSRLVLLAGGDKSTQTRDIAKATELSRLFREA